MNDAAPDQTTGDPVLEKRAAVAKWSALGKRIGYSLYGIAIVLFFVGFATSYQPWMTTSIIVAMAVGGLLLAPAIVFAYGVKAAEREERGEPSRYS